LTTVRQPLRQMGLTAASTLLGMIEGDAGAVPGSVLMAYPELVVRRSTTRFTHLAS